MRKAKPLAFGECSRCRIPHVLRADGACPFTAADLRLPWRLWAELVVTMVFGLLLWVVVLAVGLGAVWLVIATAAHAVRAWLS